MPRLTRRLRFASRRRPVVAPGGERREPCGSTSCPTACFTFAPAGGPSQGDGLPSNAAQYRLSISCVFPLTGPGRAREEARELAGEDERRVLVLSLSWGANVCSAGGVDEPRESAGELERRVLRLILRGSAEESHSGGLEGVRMGAGGGSCFVLLVTMPGWAGGEESIGGGEARPSFGGDACWGRKQQRPRFASLLRFTNLRLGVVAVDPAPPGEFSTSPRFTSRWWTDAC